MKTLNVLLQNFRKSLGLVLFFLWISAGFSNSLLAQSPIEKPLSSKAFISLLTASPGEEVYAQYGHTAIRVCDSLQNFDLVFNYGLFDFNSPDFLSRFVRGKTDYMVGSCSYMDFLLEYQMSNRAVTEQIINLLPNEKESIWRALVKNIQPENRTYRYNFFFNNCATKPRDILIQSIQGRVDYRWSGKFKTLREEVHFFTENFPWTQYGIDFTLGAPADDSASLKSQQFAPDVLMESFSKAVILSDSARIRPLVLETNYPVTVDTTSQDKPDRTPGPVLVLWILFVFVAGISYTEYKKGKHYTLLNAVIFAVAGILGSIIAFMVFFSEHPTTDVNFLLIWLHPIHLLYAAGLIIPAFRNKIANRYLIINLPFQVFALAGGLFLPQYLHPAIYPLLLILILRSGLAVYFSQKKDSHA